MENGKVKTILIKDY